MTRFVRSSAAVRSGAALLVLAATVASRPARAADKVSTAACIEASEQARPLRRAGKLREARASLRLCSSESCPAILRKDCIPAAAQADADVPTIAFSVQGPDGADLTAVNVRIDGQLLADHLDGKALDVDPGPHTFHFETEGQPAVEKQLVIVEGVKNRLERLQMGTPKPVVIVVPPPAPVPIAPPPPPSGRRTVGFIVGGSGLGLLAVGGAAGLVATLEWSAAKNACGSTFPVSCNGSGNARANGDASATLAASAVADITLGVGAVGLVTGAVLVLSAPNADRGGPAGSSRGWFLAPEVGPTANGLMLHGSF